MAYELANGTVQLEFGWHRDGADSDAGWTATLPGRQGSLLYYEIAPYEACLGRDMEPPPPPSPEEWDGKPGEYWYVWVMDLASLQGEYLPTPYPSAEHAMYTIEKAWGR